MGTEFPELDIQIGAKIGAYQKEYEIKSKGKRISDKVMLYDVASLKGLDRYEL